MKILIFTATAGNGHNSASIKIAEELKKNKENEIEIVDAYKTYSSKLYSLIIDKGYRFACQRLLPIYNFFFAREEKKDFRVSPSFRAISQGYSVMYGIIKKIEEFKPDCIISTYIFSTVALANLRRVYNIPAKIVSMALDYDVVPFWECTSDKIDIMFMASESQKQRFLNIGFDESRLIYSGIPTIKKEEISDKKQICEKLGISEDKFTVLIMKASFFPLTDGRLISKLKKTDKDIQYIIVNGTDSVKKRVEKLIKRKGLKQNIVNLGYIKNVSELFCVSDLVVAKGGGLTTTEILRSQKPALIFNEIPQQEKHNKDYLIELGVAKQITKKNFVLSLNNISRDKNEYEKLYNKSKNINILDGVSVICKTVNSFNKANYEDFTFTDSKRLIRRKVSIARRIRARKLRQLKKTNI